MSKLLYKLGVWGYGAAIRLATVSSPKARKFVAGRVGLIEHIEETLEHEKRPRVWMHCASLGEFEQGRPVLELLRQRHPGEAFIITFFSPSGYEVRRDYAGADYVFYLPEDTAENARRFLRVVKPRLALFVKYDLWLHYLSELDRQNIPTVLFAAIFRKRQGFFQWYGGVQRQMLGLLKDIFVQDEQSKTLLAGIGINNVAIAGDTRFDRVVAATRERQELSEMENFSRGSSLIVAGSTWSQDEALLAAWVDGLPENWKLVIVPHEVDTDHLRSIESLFRGRIARWGDKGSSQHRVLLVDRVGLLLSIYQYASIAYVGGGFGKAGVHNVLEPAALGLPVIHGPIFHQFIEAQALVAAGGACVTKNVDGLSKILEGWTKNESARIEAGAKAKAYVISGTGATTKIVDYLDAKYWLMTL
jgi:3-deoxy-D-manno-octulosonic-acid transferase